MMTDIRIVEEDEADFWDAIVCNSPHGTIFHQWKWLKIAEKHSNSKLFPLVGLKGEVPIGIIPLFFQKSSGLKMVFSPIPHTAMLYLGPVMVNYDKLKQDKKEIYLIEFQKSIDDFVSNELKADYVSIGLPPGLTDSRPFKWAGYSVEPSYDYGLDISAGSEAVWSQLKKNLRQDINRAIRKGYCIEHGKKAEFEYIVDSMMRRYKEQQKIATVPKEYLLEIYETFKDNINVFVAKYEGEILTGVLDVTYNNCIYSWVGNPKTTIEISPSPNDLLNWEAIKFGCEQGYSYYGIMGAAGNMRLFSYSAKFNPELKVRYYVKKSSNVARILEKGYSGVLKPLLGKIRE